MKQFASPTNQCDYYLYHISPKYCTTQPIFPICLEIAPSKSNFPHEANKQQIVFHLLFSTYFSIAFCTVQYICFGFLKFPLGRQAIYLSRGDQNTVRYTINTHQVVQQFQNGLGQQCQDRTFYLPFLFCSVSLPSLH